MQKITKISELTRRNHQFHEQFECVQTGVGQRFAGNRLNGLSYYYYLHHLHGGVNGSALASGACKSC